MEEPILLNFLNLFTSFCPALFEKTAFHFSLGLGPFILHFLKILLFQKSHSLFKLTFRATQLQQRPMYDILPKALFCILMSSTNLELNALPIAAGQYL